MLIKSSINAFRRRAPPAKYINDPGEMREWNRSEEKNTGAAFSNDISGEVKSAVQRRGDKL